MGVRPARRHDRRRLLVCVGVALLGGCATYSERLETARLQVGSGDYPGAAKELSRAAGVSGTDELPNKWKGDRPLAVLERAVVLQAQEDFEGSARDLSGAETELELLDLKTDSVGMIGKYVYSDSANDYEASPTERLALNGLNLLNYLALGDLVGASVEARRFTVMRDYLDSIGFGSHAHFGSFLAGFTFERQGEGDRALRYYEEALGGPFRRLLEEPVRRLAARHPYRGPAIEKLLAESGGPRAAAAPTEVLTVLLLGRVPYKVPKRIPIGAAVGIAGTFVTGNAAILERSLFKVVVYPELEPSGARARGGTVRLDGRPVPVDLVGRLGPQIEKEYEEIKPRIIGAALTRMIARALVAEGARAAGRQAGSGGAIIGLLAALAAEGTLVALDKPDTRSWTFLPNRALVGRTPVSPGRHQVEVAIEGVSERRSVEVDVPEGGFAVVVVTVPR